MKKFSFNKKKLIQVLFVLAAILLAANIIADKYLNQAPMKNYNSITDAEINSKFLSALDAFALQRNWIKAAGSNGKKNYSIEIPKDLPIPVVLNEIYGIFFNDDVLIRSVETKTQGKTSLSISSEGKVKLNAEFNYNNIIERQNDSTGLLIQGLEQQSKTSIEYMIKFPQTFAALLVPSKYSAQLCDSLLEFRKEYAVLLNDKSADMDFELRSGFSDARVKSVLLSILAAYPNALFFVIDDKSKLYSSPVYKIIKDGLQKRNIKLFKMKSIVQMRESGSDDIRQKFVKLVKKNAGSLNSGTVNNRRLILINAEDFNTLQPEIFSLIKIGYKFINPSIVIK